MEAHDYPIKHFRMMVEIATHLKSVPALILEHSYDFECFGSWWFTFKRSGKRFRVSFDGRDKFLSLTRGVVAADGSKRITEWQPMNEKQLTDVSFERLILEVCSLTAVDDEGKAK